MLVVFFYYFSFQERSFLIIRYFFKLKENKTGTSNNLYVHYLMGEKSCKNLKSRWRAVKSYSYDNACGKVWNSREESVSQETWKIVQVLS